MVLKVRYYCIMCENSILVASAIGELKHFEYLSIPVFVDSVTYYECNYFSADTWVPNYVA